MTATNRIYETPDAPSTYSDHYLLVDKSGAVSATKVRIDAFKDWLLAGYTSGYVGGNIATLTNGTAAAGQKTVTVDSTTGFVAGGYAAYALVGGAFEYNLIATVTDPTHLLLTNNIGTGGIGDNVFVGLISPEQYASANAIPHAGSLVMPNTIAYANAGRFHVAAYGAAPGAAQSVNTAAINAAIAAAKAAGGGTVMLGAGTYAYDGSIDLCETHDIKLVGATGHFGTVLECHNSGKACIEIIGSKQITLEDLRIVGHGSDTPAVGIWTGRADPGVYAGGRDTSQIVGNRLQIYGAFTKALIYNTGCESNWWTQCFLSATNAACMAGVMTDFHNELGLTPEHTTLDLTYSNVMSVIDKCIITCSDAATAFSPIYTVFDYSPEIYNSYLVAYGAPIVYLKGGMPGTSLVIRDTGVEQTPTYLVYGDYSATYGGTFRLDLSRFGGGVCSSGYSIFLEDNSVLTDSQITQCAFSGNVRFYTVQNTRIEGLSWYGVSNPTLTIAGDTINSFIRVNENDTLTLSGSLVNVTVDYDKDASSGYLLLAGGKGLAIGGAPGASAQAVIRRTLTASATWAPGAIADNATARTYVTVSGVTQADQWFCMAHFAGISGVAGWDLSAVAYDGGVGVTLTNRSGGALTPTGTLTVLAMKVEET